MSFTANPFDYNGVLDTGGFTAAATSMKGTAYLIYGASLKGSAYDGSGSQETTTERSVAKVVSAFTDGSLAAHAAARVQAPQIFPYAP